MITAPKSMRLQIGIFGRTNVGKSSFLNMVAGQDVSIISDVAGTTTDVVEKSMEFLPIGPVVFLDTAGVDDFSVLAEKRNNKTEKIFSRADIAVLICEVNIWGEYEDGIVEKLKKNKVPFIVVVNKIDLAELEKIFIDKITKTSDLKLECSSLDKKRKNSYRDNFKSLVAKIIPDDFIKPQPLIGDLLPSGGHAIFIVPIDLQAPKGRLILPQVQSIRDSLDADASVTIVKEREFRYVLENFKRPPDLVVCDSQIVNKMVADTPSEIKCTTFSTLFARFKGDLVEEVKGACMIDKLQSGDKVLIAEACSHHALEDDIGRVKIPRWLRQYTGDNLNIDVYSGRDYPENLSDFKLIIHCGACMLTRKEMLFRIEKAKEAGVAVTNYGVCISFVQGVLKRVLSPFPAALEAYNEILKERL